MKLTLQRSRGQNGVIPMTEQSTRHTDGGKWIATSGSLDHYHEDPDCHQLTRATGQRERTNLPLDEMDPCPACCGDVDPTTNNQNQDHSLIEQLDSGYRGRRGGRDD